MTNEELIEALESGAKVVGICDCYADLEKNELHVELLIQPPPTYTFTFTLDKSK